jgi:bacillithiol biosynthesis deacetylase BshB1
LKNKKLHALFFGSHPDDIELTCGGTLIKLVDDGKNAGICDLTQGELSTRGNLQIRKKETENANKTMGISCRENLKLKDGDIQNTYANRLKIIKILRIYKPEIVFAPYPDDRHPDHINASNIIRESVYYSGLKKIVIPKTEAYRPKKIYYYRHAFEIPVSFIVDISDTFEKKMKAIKCYDSQFYSVNKKSEPETYISSKLFYYDIESKARYHGFKIGTEFGEPFYCPENLKINSKNLFEI